MWSHFLIAHWHVLPEDIRQKVKAYDILRKASQLQTHRAAILDEVQSLERTLEQVARQYGWGG